MPDTPIPTDETGSAGVPDGWCFPDFFLHFVRILLNLVVFLRGLFGFFIMAMEHKRKKVKVFLGGEKHFLSLGRNYNSQFTYGDRNSSHKPGFPRFARGGRHA